MGYFLTAIMSGMAGWFLCSLTHKKSPEVINNSQEEIDNLSTIPARKYTEKSGKYYESVWDGNAYASGIEITAEEYAFLTNKQFSKH